MINLLTEAKKNFNQQKGAANICRFNQSSTISKKNLFALQ